MRERPQVSVIMIFLNAEPFLQEAIESVFAQTYDRWELILVDDGSTDASTPHARRHAARCPEKVCYLEHDGHQNRGMSASRNLGLRHARGEYIAFLDADDVWVPQTLARQVTLLECQPQAAMVYGPAQWWYSWTGKPEDGTRDFIQPLGVPPHTLITPPRLLLRFLRQPLFAPVGILARRAVIERIGGYEEAFRGLYEDQAFYAKLCLEAPVFAVPESWYQYRRHAGACCMVARQEGQGPAARLRFLHWLAAYVVEREGRRGQVWRAVQRELWRYRHPRLYRLFRQASYRRRQLARVADPMAWQRVLVHVRRRLRLYRPRHGG